MKQFGTIFILHRKLVRQVKQVGRGQGFIQIFSDVRIVAADATVFDQGQTLLAPTREKDMGTTEQFQCIGKSLLTSAGPLGNSPNFSKVAGIKGHDPVRLTIIEPAQDNRFCFMAYAQRTLQHRPRLVAQ